MSVKRTDENENAAMWSEEKIVKKQGVAFFFWTVVSGRPTRC